MPRPVVHVPVPHVKTVPQSEMRRNVKRKGENGIANSNLTETQNKSSVANKFVDMAMENMYCKIIAFALFHLYFAILYFCLQNLFSSCNTSFSLKFFIFVYKKHIYIFSIHSFSFAKLYFLLQRFNSLANIYGIVLTPYASHYFFFEQLLGWCPPGTWCPMQTAAVPIFIVHDIVHIAQTGLQGHFSVGPQRGSYGKDFYGKLHQHNEILPKLFVMRSGKTHRMSRWDVFRKFEK